MSLAIFSSETADTACFGCHSGAEFTDNSRRIIDGAIVDGEQQPAEYSERRFNGPCEVVAKFMGGLWASEFAHSPLDVVAWHGDYVPYKYELARFMAINSVSFDHPDPSIFTVLTSPSGRPGVANCDFVIFPPRWSVAEDTFRPPWFHRNVMSELMGLVHGVYDAKAEGFLPGGVSIHNCMSAHGPDAATYEKASNAKLEPQKIADTLAFMWESRYVFRPTEFALSCPQLQKDYDKVWDGFGRNA